MSEMFASAQCLIRLKVTDAVSDRFLSDVSLAVMVRTEAGGERPSPFALRSARDGWFVMAMSLLDLSAKMKTGADTEFRFTVSKPGYTPQDVVLAITAAEFQIIDDPITVGGESYPRRRVSGAPFEREIALAPLPVRLAGVVLEDNALDAPIAGATVKLDDAGATETLTDAEGRFLFETLPLEQSVSVTATHDGRSVTRSHILTFSQPTNQLTLSIPSEPTV